MVRKSITLPPDLLEGGKARAKAEGRRFANYVAWLIRRDLENAQRELKLEGGAA